MEDTLILEKIREAKPEDFDKISDIGPVVSKSVYEWFQDKGNLKLLDRLEEKIKITNPASAEASAGKQKLNGKIFVLTGSLETMSRDEAKAKIRELGGNISESVSAPKARKREVTGNFLFLSMRT